MSEQPAASKSEEERFLEEIGELKSPDAWLLFINCGFSMTTAKSLHDKGLIEASLQMGMPAARLKQPDAEGTKKMKRPTDKELMDAIEAKLARLGVSAADGSDLIAYAQLRAIERLADNVFNLEQTLAVIRADLVAEGGQFSAKKMAEVFRGAVK